MHHPTSVAACPAMPTLSPEAVQTLADKGDIEAARAAAREGLLTLKGNARGQMLLVLSTVSGNAGDALDSLRSAVAAREDFQAVAADAPDAAAARVGECDALVRMATALRLAGDHATAIATLEQAEALARAVGQADCLARVMRVMGICCSVIGRHHHALSALSETEELVQAHGTLAEQLNVRLSTINARNRLSASLPVDSAERREMLQGLVPQWQALSSASQAAGLQRLQVMAQGNLAITLAELQRHAEAIALLQALEPQYRTLGMRPNEGLCLSKLGRSHLALGQAQVARDAALRAVAVFDEGGALDDLLEALEVLSDAEEACANPSGALAALRRVRDIERRRSDAAACEAVLRRELRIELARLTTQWARHATTDPLTGLANRRALDTWMNEHLPRAEHGMPLSVLLLDLDHFKWINDSFGHAAGDEVLRRVARLVEQRCSKGGLAVRYGGEEFVLALAGVDIDDAAALAEQLRCAITAEPWHAVAAGLKVSTSIGVARALEAATAPELFTLADRRLYAAKFGGRDRVVVSG